MTVTDETRVWGFTCYFSLCSLGVVSASVLTILLWSLMGFGEDCLQFLIDNETYKFYTFGCSVIILFILYILDFFAPPHLHGQHLALFEGDFVVGRSFFAGSVLLFIASCFFQADTYPGVPLVSTTLLCPLSVAAVRVLQGSSLVKTTRLLHGLHGSNGESLNSPEFEKLSEHDRILENLLRQETDALHFYKAAASSFLLWGFVVLIVWSVWAVSYDLKFKPGITQDEEEVVYLLWSAPLVVAVSNIIFGLMAVLRVSMHATYSQIEMMDVQRKSTDGNGNARDLSVSSGVRQLMLVIRVIGCAFMLLIGLLYVAGQLLYADSKLATMVMGMMGSFFTVYLIFTYLSFRRVVVRLSLWVKHLPIWNTARTISKSPWIHALVVIPMLPYIPLVMAVSALNQCVRLSRGVYDKMDKEKEKDPTHADGLSHSHLNMPDPATRLLTPRVDHVLTEMMTSWDWLAVIERCYWLILVYVCMTICPLLLNLTLAWVKDYLEVWPFWAILVGTFGIGMVAFMLPPVPGMTIYIFGGLVITDTCPWGDGFWTGTVLNILLGWVLKLVACAIQQQCIGGMLGQVRWVKATVGVHKVTIRCIEAVMKAPGWTLGKVAILCGGPDWPVSVMAGMLGLSLVQCEIGTLPIIGFVIPCALSGSFYLKKAESALWSRSANLMMFASFFVSMILWAVAGWAIQEKLESNYEELTTPLPQYVDLYWDDHKEAEIAKVASVRWTGVPCCVRTVYALGCFLQIGIFQVLLTCYYSLFGDFQVHEDVKQVKWYGDVDDAIFTFFGTLTLVVYFVAWFGFISFKVWLRSATRAPRAKVIHELSSVEAEWKAEFLRTIEAKQETKQPPESSTSEPEKTDDKEETLVECRTENPPNIPVCFETPPLPAEDAMPYGPLRSKPHSLLRDGIAGDTKAAFAP